MSKIKLKSWGKNHSNKRSELIARNPVFRAFAREPMRKEQQTDMATAARMAFEYVQRGTGTDEDRNTLVGMVNVGMVLAGKHCDQSDLDDQLAAQDAILRADGRAMLGKRWGFDGPGRSAMLCAMDSMEQMIAQVGQDAVTEAALIVLEMRANGHVHHVEVVQP